jgi:putative peptidoglycan lipid II flippase
MTQSSSSPAPQGAVADASPSKTPPRLARSAGLIGLATMMSRLLGLVREQLMAYLFGAGDAVDAYNVAFRVPNLLRDLFAEGAMSAAFVPTFTRKLTTEGQEAAWKLGNNVVTTLLVVTGGLVCIGWLYAAPLVHLYAGDYEQVPGKLELAASLARIMLPFLIVIAVAAAQMGMLNSLDRFFVPALSPAVFNVGSIAATLLLVGLMPRFGVPPITAMAIGVLIGGLGQVIIQWPMLWREGYRYRPTIDLRDPGLHQVLLLMGPGTLGLAATQINIFVNTMLATSQGTGAVSWLGYAFRIMYMPLGIFGVSIATASVPSISRRAAKGDMAGVRTDVAHALSLMLALSVPATLGLMVLARPIVALLYERGAFTAADTQATATALVCYASGLVGYSAVRIASPTFYALRDSRVPVIVSAWSVLLNASLSVVLGRFFGYPGLAAGTSIAAVANATMLLYLLRRRLGGLEGRRLAGVMLRAVLAATTMAAAAWALHRQLTVILPGHTLARQSIQLGGAIVGALIVLSGAARVLRLDELNELWESIRRRIVALYRP